MSHLPWFKVDDGLHSHPKALAAGDAALGLWVRLGSWSSNHLTDGLIPTAAAHVLGKPAVFRRLVDVGLLERTPDGYQLHDFLAYNPTREQVEQERAATAQRVTEWRARRKAVTNGESNGVGNGVTHAVSNGGCTPAPTRPDPLTTEQPPTEVVANTSDEPPRTPSRARQTTARGTRVPDTWPPPEQAASLAAWAREHAPAVQIVRETAMWQDWHRANGKTARDWAASWRNWMGRAQKDAETRGPRSGPARTSTTDQRVAQTLALGARFAEPNGRRPTPIEGPRP